MEAALIPLVATPVIAEALKLWGAFALVVLMLGVMLWRSERTSKAREAELAKLRADIDRLQEQRLEDAKKLIAVAQSGTATMAQRTEGDAKQQEILSLLVQVLPQVLQRAGTIPVLPPSTMLPLRSP